jgi:hypothetical protein
VKRPHNPFCILHSAFCIALAALAASADTAATSAGDFVFVNADTSSYWHTATNATLTLPIDFPAGVSSATLTVTAPSYAASYEIAASGDFTLTLPAATSPTTENVYDLVLDFGNGVVQTAKLGLIKGYDTTTTGETRCLAPKEQRKWGWVRGRAVLPIPYGMTAFTVDGVATDTGLNGAQGWYPLCLKSGETANLALDADGESFAASLWRVFDATLISIR